MPLSCLIVDDEPLAQRVLERYVGMVEALHLVQTCSNAFEAMNALHRHPVDVIFLDIQMPELTGMAFLKTLTNPPAVVLTTAYTEFALEGYEHGVADYLLKPISFDRFLKAVNRVMALRSPSTVVVAPPAAAPAPEADFLFLKADKKIHKRWFRDIALLEAAGNYVKIHDTAHPLLLASETLTALEERLPAGQFLRVHKSFIVSVQHITAVAGSDIHLGKWVAPIGVSYRQKAEERLRELGWR